MGLDVRGFPHTVIPWQTAVLTLPSNPSCAPGRGAGIAGTPGRLPCLLPALLWRRLLLRIGVLPHVQKGPLPRYPVEVANAVVPCVTETALEAPLALPSRRSTKDDVSVDILAPEGPSAP